MGILNFVFVTYQSCDLDMLLNLCEANFLSNRDGSFLKIPF